MYKVCLRLLVASAFFFELFDVNYSVMLGIFDLKKNRQLTIVSLLHVI